MAGVWTAARLTRSPSSVHITRSAMEIASACMVSGPRSCKSCNSLLLHNDMGCLFCIKDFPFPALAPAFAGLAGKQRASGKHSADSEDLSRLSRGRNRCRAGMCKVSRVAPPGEKEMRAFHQPRPNPCHWSHPTNLGYFNTHTPSYNLFSRTGKRAPPLSCC